MTAASSPEDSGTTRVETSPGGVGFIRTEATKDLPYEPMPERYVIHRDREGVPVAAEFVRKPLVSSAAYLATATPPPPEAFDEGSAQEPADPPPDPQWLVDAIWEGHSDRGNEGWYADGTTVAERVIRAALPILRAGIEQELRGKLADELEAFPHTGPDADVMWTAATHVRGQS